MRMGHSSSAEDLPEPNLGLDISVLWKQRETNELVWLWFSPFWMQSDVVAQRFEMDV